MCSTELKIGKTDKHTQTHTKPCNSIAGCKITGFPIKLHLCLFRRAFYSAVEQSRFYRSNEREQPNVYNTISIGLLHCTYHFVATNDRLGCSFHCPFMTIRFSWHLYRSSGSIPIVILLSLFFIFHFRCVKVFPSNSRKMRFDVLGVN